jgi:hypothetical protein
MAKYVKINNNKVIDAIEATSDSIKNRVDTIPGTWVQTDKAGIGMNYDPIKDIFYGNSPYPSWVLDDKGYWNPPEGSEKPDSLDSTYWDEGAKGWQVVDD